MNARHVMGERGAADGEGRGGGSADVVQGQRRRVSIGDVARQKLLAGLAVTERRLQLSGVSTVVLEGGTGTPMVFLHGPAGSAVDWWRVIPELVTMHRVVIPDLPGQGASEIEGDPLDADGAVARVLVWLAELIEHTCPTPPTLVGYAMGGAIAARFARDYGDRLGGLVLIGSLGLSQFEPAPAFGQALQEFLAGPNERTHDNLWRRCAMDLDGMRQRIGEEWEAFEAYNLDRARTPSVMATLGVLMEQFGVPAIEPAELARISVPTTLIWGRHGLATPLRIAEAASERYGWPLRIIEECGNDPQLEQPGALVTALRGGATLRERRAPARRS